MEENKQTLTGLSRSRLNISIIVEKGVSKRIDAMKINNFIFSNSKTKQLTGERKENNGE